MIRASLALACAALALSACAPEESGPFAGAQRCAECHADQFARWRGSHHDLAMQEADEGSVLGDFDDAELSHMGVVSRFSREDSRLVVATEGPEGQSEEFEIAYTFGAAPLQQYLVRLPQGRLQALTVAWDARPAREGGQRWFSLQPDERVPPGDPLHWTGPAQRWNLMCADCHSTGLQKGYELDGDRYQTSWAEIDVGCEACHGPGAAHVAWAEGSGDPEGRALPVRFPPRAEWSFEGDAPIATRAAPLESRVEVETCARCHARRARLAESTAGSPFLDTHRPALLAEGLYHADGQIDDEVYVYGSFLQSRMHAAGVSCSDCHEPHGLEVSEGADDTCARCHRPDAFAMPAHHHHEPESAGASCVACHMPEQMYMVIDGRRDHGLKIPRPDLSVEIGVPNACNGCHGERSAQWAADVVRSEFRAGREPPPHFGQVIAAGRARAPGAANRLAALALDTEQPGIVRASALALLADQPAPVGPEVVELAARDPDPLVRMAAGGAARSLPPEQRLAATAHLLRDPLLAVRLEALGALMAVPAQAWSPRDRSRLALAQQEYRAAQAAAADRPESHVNLGILELRSGDLEAAQRSYETALRIGPYFLPAYVNLADLFRASDQEVLGEQMLRRGLEREPESAELWHALGLLLVRGERTGDALDALARAVELDDDNPRYVYVYGVALYSAGRSPEAIPLLERGHRRHPGDPDLLFALATMHRDLGDFDSARIFAAKLGRLLPGDSRAAGLAAELAATR